MVGFWSGYGVGIVHGEGLCRVGVWRGAKILRWGKGSGKGKGKGRVRGYIGIFSGWGKGLGVEMLEVLGLKRGGRGGIFYLGPSGAHHGKTFGVISGLGRGLIFRGVGWLGSG